MEIKSLIPGLIFGVAIFGIKTGLGLSYVFSRTASPGKGIAVSLGAGLLYLAAFLGMAQVFKVLEIWDLLHIFSKILASGMLLHLVMAALMTIWGLRLLRTGQPLAGLSGGWAALALPCPVCLVMILFVTGFLSAWFPGQSTLAVLLAYGAFVGAAAAALAGSRLFASKGGQPPEQRLGASMLAVAGYFLLTVLVAPHAAEMDTIFSLARATARSAPLAETNTPWCIPLFLGAAAMGFLWRWIHIRRHPLWT